MSRMIDRKKDDRPREKIKTKGVKSLTNEELVMAIIGSGSRHADVTKISRNLTKVLRENSGRVTYEDLEKVTGMGPAKVSQLVATFELANRYTESEQKNVIDSPEKILPYLEDIRDKKQEYFVLITLDGANRVIKKRIITIGTLTASLVHPREVFAPAIEDRAASIIVAHNHPSGNLDPSSADIEITKRVRKAGELLGINMIDHIIVAKSGYNTVDE